MHIAYLQVGLLGSLNSSVYIDGVDSAFSLHVVDIVIIG